MAVQKQDDQHEHTFSNYVRIQDVVLKTCLRRWTIGKSGERGSGISMLPAQHNDDDDDDDDILTELYGSNSSTGIQLHLTFFLIIGNNSHQNHLYVPQLIQISDKMLYGHLQHHNDIIIITQEDFFNKYVPLTLLQGFEKVIQGLRVRGIWRPNWNCNILTPLLWPATLWLSRSPDVQPEAQRPTLLGDGFLYCILSASSLDPNSSGPQGPFSLMWLYVQLVYLLLQI